MILVPNQFYTHKDKVVVLNGRITIESLCNEHCENIWSRINAIIIEPMEDPNGEEARFALKKSSTQNLGCGNAFKGGRCEDKDSKDVENCVYETIDS